MKAVLVMHAGDNVGNAIEEITSGDTVEYVLDGESHRLQAIEKVPFMFKIAVKPISASGDILKYGEPVGKASRDIRQGECVHIHNVEGSRGRGDRKGGAA